ncbi:starvation-inducible DNA-binding protein [Breznakibacter xylanolyticus]|uniref:Starvation-inducible DNA-binding protein n=1 Tax=Breznakibacter xylanolyticus TaxID=990 RepID=A0A2W7NGU5_9BACT|nr:Dps family protein [Breznakibacter xylanolyticus]MBN2742941.1 DNA starvation/stationary phase protection protein [Marinilabiliaceae bacterium]PZX19458.1 starvation-inducible DNA-binding protein [Breznakibacter xylanolyticus]
MNAIGLNIDKSAALAVKLNHLLSAYQVFYMNARGFHWNIKGEKFFELHLKFEELYNDFQLKIDDIAERILTLGKEPLHTYTDYLAVSVVKPVSGVSDGKTAVENILDGFQKVLLLQRELLAMAADANDEGTNALMSDYIREQEKLVWMYSAYLNRG